MSENIVFLDASTIGPGVTVRRPGFPHEWTEYASTEPGQTGDRLKAASIAITNKVPIGVDVLDQAPGLKLIAVAATGYDVVDLEACKARSIAVANIRGYAVNTVPEHTFALMLALRRNLIEYRQQVLDGEWVRSGQFCFFNRPVRDLSGSTLGIIGAGSIGQAVGRIGAAFGMNVEYFDAYAKQAPEVGTLVSLETLRDNADVLTCHCPLTPETENLVDEEFLTGMKPTAIVINTARGGIIDEAALVRALQAGKIAGAGIDVTATEPAPMNGAMMQAAASMPNVVLTPHVAWASVGGMQTLCDQMIGNIEAFVDGSPRNLV